MIAFESEKYGYHFRSFLERRWATCFQSLNWFEWEYEPEGYRLSDGSGYIPDYLIRADGWHELYLEIKPTNSAVDAAFDKLAGFFLQTGSLAVIIGSPGTETIRWYRVWPQSVMDRLGLDENGRFDGGRINHPWRAIYRLKHMPSHTQWGSWWACMKEWNTKQAWAFWVSLGMKRFADTKSLWNQDESKVYKWMKSIVRGAYRDARADRYDHNKGGVS